MRIWSIKLRTLFLFKAVFLTASFPRVYVIVLLSEALPVCLPSFVSIQHLLFRCIKSLHTCFCNNIYTNLNNMKISTESEPELEAQCLEDVVSFISFKDIKLL